MFGWNKIFKTRSYYVFDYKPRYYDERKERLEKLKEKYSLENNQENNLNIKDITLVFEKKNLKNSWKKTKSGKDYNSIWRIALIVTILFGIVAYILKFS